MNKPPPLPPRTMANLFYKSSVKQIDFYKIDHGLFAPALIMINNTKTGRTFKAGKINPKVLAKALGF